MSLFPGLSELWSHELPGYITTEGDRVGDLFYQGVGGVFYAIDVHDGHTRWSQEYDAHVVGGTAEVTAIVPVEARRSGTMFGLSTATGEIVWTRDLDGALRYGQRANPSRSSTMRLQDTVYAAVLGRGPMPELREVDPDTGEMRSVVEMPGGDRPLCAPSGIFVARAQSPQVWWFDGSEARELEVETVAYHLTAARGRLLTWHKSHREHRLWDLESGACLGRFTGDPLWAALDDEQVVVPDGKELVCWDLETGAESWRVLPGRKAYRNSTFLGPYVVNQALSAHVIRRDTGEVVVEHTSASAPRCYDDGVSLWLRGKTLYRMQATAD